jgi:glutamine amidotransferase
VPRRLESNSTMCRLLGVVSLAPRSFGLLLDEAPRSMAILSEKHRDGWGIAARQRGRGWTLRRSLLRAGDDDTFHGLAAATLGEVLIAHVRQRTRGAVRLENTHPFLSSRWVFAHNGTIEDVDYLRAHVSPERLAELRGDTDSELMFAFVLSRLDGAVLGIDHALRTLTLELANRPKFGTASFLLSNGDTLWAHRFGPPLHLLERQHCVLPCVAVTTEPITDEPWLALDDADLVRVDRDPSPRWTRLLA